MLATTRLDQQPVLHIDNLSVTYEQHIGIRHVNLTVYAGEMVAIIGPNGAGKSTLIKAIMGLQAHSGTVSAHCPLGYVPQYESLNWDFPATVRDAVMMGRTQKIGWLRRPGAADRQAVDDALGRVGLVDLAERPLNSLSGGQRRRLFIARALVQEAQLLILDEPFSAVDASAQEGIMAVLEGLRAHGLSIVLSTHDLNLAFSRFDRVVALRQEIIAEGSPDEICRREVLDALYGGKLTLLDGGMTLVVDDHGC